MTTATSAPVTDTDKTLDAPLATVAGEIIGVCAGSHRLLVSITTACQQAGAGLPVRR